MVCILVLPGWTARGSRIWLSFYQKLTAVRSRYFLPGTASLTWECSYAAQRLAVPRNCFFSWHQPCGWQPFRRIIHHSVVPHTASGSPSVKTSAVNQCAQLLFVTVFSLEWYGTTEQYQNASLQVMLARSSSIKVFGRAKSQLACRVFSCYPVQLGIPNNVVTS
eukprot:1424966-Rhodomonas_salina.2